MVLYYLDTCIWLNLFKKEGDATKGKPYWEIAKEFLEQARPPHKIIISTIVLKELKYILGKSFDSVLELLKTNDFVEIIKTHPEDYDFARKLEREDSQNISFYDYLHISIAKRIRAVLITRDKEMIKRARKLIDVYMPEDLLG